MNINGIIIEGVCCTGKSFLLEQLLKNDKFNCRSGKSVVCLTEHHTQRVLEPLIENNNLTKEQHIEHLNYLAVFLSQLDANCQKHNWSQRGRMAHIVTYILERFHLTHSIDYSYLSWDDVKQIDSILSGINGKLVILTINADILHERLYNDSRDPGWLEYLSGISEDKKEVVDFYMKKQDQLLYYAEKSSLPKIILDNSDTDIGGIINQVLKFWTEY